MTRPTIQLSTGAIATMIQGGKVDDAILQIISYKKVAGEGERYRLLISDGRHMNSLALLGSQLAHMVHNHEITNNTVVKVNKYVMNNIQANKKVFVLLDVTVVAPGTAIGKIGNPVTYTGAEDAPPAAPKPATPAKPVVTPATPATPTPSTGGASIGSSLSTQNILPIAHITPYANRWTIRGRITNKTPIRTWSNARGEGKLFAFEMLDESGEIRCTAFKEECDKFYDMLEVGKVYYVSRGQLKPANRQYCGSIQHDFEMSLNRETQIELCHEDTNIPGMQFNFVPIPDLEKLDKTGLVDVIGVCKDAGSVDTIMSKKLQKELTKRDIKLVDQSNTEVNLTLWGSQAETFDGIGNPVVAIKGAKLSDFNGCSLGTVSSSQIQINPDLEEAHRLKGWFDNEGVNMQSVSISNQRGGAGGGGGEFKSIGQAKLENIGANGEVAYYNVCARVMQIRSENCMYKSCPNGDCKKKVLDQQNGLFRCEKCNQEFTEFRWRMLMSMNIADMTGSQWVTAFQESAEAVLGISAAELGRLQETDLHSFQEIFRTANFQQFNFRLRVKMEMYNDVSRLRAVVASATPVNADLQAHKKRLQDEVNALANALDAKMSVEY